MTPIPHKDFQTIRKCKYFETLLKFGHKILSVSLQKVVPASAQTQWSSNIPLEGRKTQFWLEGNFKVCMDPNVSESSTVQIEISKGILMDWISWESINRNSCYPQGEHSYINLQLQSSPTPCYFCLLLPVMKPKMWKEKENSNYRATGLGPDISAQP